jgi:hypothetical protein
MAFQFHHKFYSLKTLNRTFLINLIRKTNVSGRFWEQSGCFENGHKKCSENIHLIRAVSNQIIKNKI